MTGADVMAAVAQAGRRLEDLWEAFVLVGGSAVPFLVPASMLSTLRTTEDVDCVVEAATTVDYYRLADRLRALGFSECVDEGAPICRWVVDGIRVDRAAPHGVYFGVDLAPGEVWPQQWGIIGGDIHCDWSGPSCRWTPAT